MMLYHKEAALIATTFFLRFCGERKTHELQFLARLSSYTVYVLVTVYRRHGMSSTFYYRTGDYVTPDYRSVHYVTPDYRYVDNVTPGYMSVDYITPGYRSVGYVSLSYTSCPLITYLVSDKMCSHFHQVVCYMHAHTVICIYAA